MKRKNDKAITLIALIITIIIMLILAGVVINFVLGENGIIKLARQAGKNYVDAENDEKRNIEELYSSILIATNGDSHITISMEDLNSLISAKAGEEVQKAVWGESVTPTGTIIAQMGNEAPAGYIKCDGTIYNISEYKQLAEYIKSQFGKYDHFGGNGTTTFAVPDLRGEFLRGTGTAIRDSGSGSDVGVHQDGTLQAAIEATAGGAWIAAGNVRVMNQDEIIYRSGFKSIAGQERTESSSHMYTSRPTNTSVLYCIKY